MKIRTLSIACVTTAAVVLAGCTAVYKNTDACEQAMRSKLADVSPEQMPEASIDKLSVDHTGTGIHGSRVVVEASLSHMQTASEVAAASAPKGASGAAAASAVSVASASPRASHGQMASAAAAAAVDSSDAASDGVSTTAKPATVVAAASGASAAAANAKPVKPKKVVKSAAVECRFDGLNLASFRWLAPPELVKTNDTAASDTQE
ncbi:MULTISPECIES: hypothetical protein [Paraburkholderia]|uniref:Lipoprotein n=1 Tax=Paraburkholderia phenazinium TaxID=60549 RepID=A0A1N6FXM3_9BURK|nr:hypothetical protein [Paraburkholderia phenazinium]SIN99957.1 hypothetical protein SAMN05444168_1945 [Paraburkholderia phenazinium]